MNTKVQAVILAAGAGNRLLPFTRVRPKCLVDVGGVPILVNALNLLARSGCRSATIVVGHMAEHVQNTIGDEFSGMPISYVVNANYLHTNTMYSLALGIERVSGPAWILEGDIFFGPDILSRNYADDISWLVDSSARQMTGTYIKVDKGGTALSIARDPVMPGSDQNKSVGILSLSAKGLGLISTWLEKAVADGRQAEFYDSILADQMASGLIRVCDIAGLSWYEIDTPEDLASAQKMFERKTLA